MENLLDHVECEDRACISRLMDYLRQIIQRNVEVTSFPVRRLGAFPDGPVAIPEEEEPYTFWRSIPLLPQITKQPAWGQMSQTTFTPYPFSPMPHSYSTQMPYVPPPVTSMTHSQIIADVPSTQPPYTPLPPPPQSAYMSYVWQPIALHQHPQSSPASLAFTSTLSFHRQHSRTSSLAKE